jgi:hypothetical protein
MASTYSTNLALELIATGEQSGTWGTTTNTNLGTLLEQSISGYVTQAITDGSGANTTITIPNGTTGVARNMFIEMTGALTFSTTNLIVPANRKLYFIFNNTTGGFPVTVKVSGLTGVSVPNGRKVILVSNGTDIVEASNAVSGNATVGGTLVVTGVTTLTGAATLSAALTYGGVTLTNNVTGTGKMVLDTSPILVTPNIGTPSAGVISACTSTAMVVTNPTVTDYVETVQALGTVGASSTLALTNGTVITATLTASTPCTFTMPTATAGKSFILILTQAATGMTTAVFTSVKYPGGTAPTITATASAKDIITFVADGTNWYGTYAQAFA